MDSRFCYLFFFVFKKKTFCCEEGKSHRITTSQNNISITQFMQNSMPSNQLKKSRPLEEGF